MFPKFFLLLLFAIKPIFGTNLEFNLRYSAETNHPDIQSLSLLQGFKPFAWNQLGYGLRLSSSLKDFEAVDYKLETTIPIFTFFSVGFRLSHGQLFPETVSISHLLAYGNLEVKPFSRWTLFVLGGWYERFGLLEKPTLFPNFYKTSYREHDCAIELGTEVQLTEVLHSLVKVSTLDEINVYNLNNPYAHFEFAYHLQPLDWILSLYARYQILLGFGRMDNFSTGVRFLIRSL